MAVAPSPGPLKTAEPIVTDVTERGADVNETQPRPAEVAGAGAWGLGGRLVLMLANLLAAPFLIRLLGPANYGLWTIGQALLAWGVLANVGMGFASTKFGADCYARRDDNGESAVVWTSLVVIGIVTTGMAAIVAVMAPYIMSHFLALRGTSVGTGVLTLRLFCAMFVAQAITTVINTPEVVRLKWGWYTVIKTVPLLLATIGGPLAIAELSGGVITVSTVWLVASVVTIIGLIILGVRLQPALRHFRFDRAVLRQLLKYGSGLMLAGLATVPLSTAERFFLARNHGTAVLAYYAVAATFATTLVALPEQMVGPLRPALTRLEAEGRWEERRALYRKALVGLFLIITPGAVLIGYIAEPFLSVWAGPVYGVKSTGPLLIVLGGVWLNCLQYVPYSYLLATGRTKVIAFVQGIEVVPYIVGAWFLTQRFGATGAAAVWSSTYALDAIVFLLVAWRVARMPFSPLSDRRLRSALAPLLLGGAALGAASFTHGLVVRLLFAVLLLAAYGAGVWRLVLTGGERDGLTRLASQVMSRRRPRRRSTVGGATRVLEEGSVRVARQQL